MTRCTQSATWPSTRRVRLGRLVPRERIAPDERDGEQERGPAEPGPVEHPREREDRQADAEPERRHEERDPEARLLGERREVGVEQVDARHLERVRGADHEADDPGVEREHGARRAEHVDAPLDPRVDDPREDEQPDPDDAEEERDRDEERPAGDVVAPRHARGAHGLRRRRRVDADAEREDAVADVAVGGELAPADGVGLPDAEPADGRADHEPAVALRDDAGDPCGRPPRSTTIASGGATTDWSNRSSTIGRRRVDPALHRRRPRGSSVACAPAVAGRASARSAAAASARLTARDPPGEVGEVAEDRRHVAVGEEHHRERDPRRREAVRPDRAPRLERLADREDRRDDERPADQVVEERRAGEEPAVLLVDEERDARRRRARRR